MKTINRMLAICATAILLVAISPNKTYAQFSASVSYQTFYDDLQPYGTWLEDPEYGDVWVPDAYDGFKPYGSSGHWVQTRYGNTWVSDYPWGWATFHYGRWRYDDYYGWEWVPGYEWGPAWVNWRSGGGYYAWAPLGPGISIDMSFGRSYHVPNDYWVCAPQAYICDPYVSRYYVPRTRMVRVINQTTIINHTYVSGATRYVAGPRLEDIQRVSRQPVRVYNINNGNDPHHTDINNNTVNMYRPNVIRNPNNNTRIRPATVVNAAAYKQANPNAGIAHRANYGATINHDNASRLAQTGRNPTPQNQNIVKFYRKPGNNAPVVSPAMRPNGNDNGKSRNNPVVQPQIDNRSPVQQNKAQNNPPRSSIDQRQNKSLPPQKGQPPVQEQVQQRQQLDQQKLLQQRQQQQQQNQHQDQQRQQQQKQQQDQQRQQQQRQQQDQQRRQQDQRKQKEQQQPPI